MQIITRRGDFLKNSDFTGQAVLQRVHDLPEPVRAVLRHVAYFICGMLFASASNLSAVSPFGVAFARRPKTSTYSRRVSARRQVIS